MLIEKAFEALTKLEQTSSRNDKMAILEENRENPVLMGLFMQAYNPFLKYHIAKIGKVTPTGEGATKERFDKFISILAELHNRTFTGNEALAIVMTFFESLSAEELKWYERTLKRDLRVGVTESTANKVWKGLIPVFDCMLADKWADVKKKPSTVYVEPKLDGYRALAFVMVDGVTIYTRNGKEIIGFTEIETELAKLPRGYVYDGEIIGKANAFNDMQKLVFRKQESGKEGTLCVFDSLPISEFMSGESSRQIGLRKEFLIQLLGESQEQKFNHLELVEFSGPMPFDSSQIDELYQFYLQEGYEGVLVKDANSFYICKRDKAWAKIKPTDTFDLTITGFKEGTGKNEGKLGAFVIEHEGFKVDVGGGFSDEEREDFWANRNDMIGKVIEVEADVESKNKDGVGSLRFPRFIRIRPDKG